MILKKIHIENFRCFKSYDVEFAPNTTVLIGKNGTGKTNLLTAIVYSLSFPFGKHQKGYIQTIGTSAPDLKVAAIDNARTFDARFDDEKDDYIYPVKLVKLDDKSRQQQVDGGFFDRIEAVPQYALTLTLPTICQANKICCLAIGAKKAQIVKIYIQ